MFLISLLFSTTYQNISLVRLLTLIPSVRVFLLFKGMQSSLVTLVCLIKLLHTPSKLGHNHKNMQLIMSAINTTMHTSVKQIYANGQYIVRIGLRFSSCL